MKLTQILPRMMAVILLSLTAKFIGAAGLAAEVQPPSAKIVKPAPGATYPTQADIVINLEVVDSDGWVSLVELWADDQKIGEVIFAPSEPPPVGETRIYTFHFSTETAGRHKLIATVTDNAGNAAISSPVEVLVDAIVNTPPPENRPPQVRITSPPDRETFHAPANLAIKGEAVDFDGWVQRVELLADDSKIAEVNVESSPATVGETQTFSFNWSNVPAGQHRLRIRATDNSGEATVSAEVQVLVTEPTSPVNRPPLVRIASPADHATFTAPAKIEINVEAFDADGWVTQVDFLANETKVGEVKVQSDSPPVAQNQTMSFTWTNVPAGDYKLTVRATDSSGTAALSTVVQITVSNPIAPNDAPLVRLTEPHDDATFKSLADVAIAAEAADSDGWVQLVEFMANGAKIGEAKAQAAPATSGEKQLFTFKWSSVPAGKYTLLAKATDNSGNVSVSKTVDVRISEPPAPEPNNLPIVTIQALDGHAAEAKGNSGSDKDRGRSDEAHGNANRGHGNSDNEHGQSGRPNPATFRVRRDGSRDADLKVSYSISGTASNGVDYAMLPGQVTIPRGAQWAFITLTPIDDKLAEPTETVVLKLELPPDASQNKSAATYAIGPRDKAVATIDDNDSPRGSSTRLHDGHFVVSMPGMKDQHVHVEASEDLVHWNVVESKTVTDDDFYFVDGDSPGHGFRYYRVVPAPGGSDDD